MRPWMMLSLLAAACQTVELRGERKKDQEPEISVPGLEQPGEISVPLMGGTLEAMPALGGVLASMGKHGELVLVYPSGQTHLLDLGEGTVPFRIEVEGERAWVTLRGTGEVALVEPAANRVVWRVPVCAEPRGLERVDDTLLVACAGGELLLLDDDGAILRRELLANGGAPITDLRDVVVADGALFVSRFRAAEVLVLDPISWDLQHRTSFQRAAVAWRMRAAPDQGVNVIVQTNDEEPLEPPEREEQGAYGGVGCEGPSVARLGLVRADGSRDRSPRFGGVVLPVDFLVDDSGILNVLDGASRPGEPSLFKIEYDYFMRERGCFHELSPDFSMLDGSPSGLALLDGEIFTHNVQPDAVGTLLSRGAPSGWFRDDAREEGFALFHQDSGAGVACAACHPEGTDDGRVWEFAGGGDGARRRTMNLSGGISQRAPYHWYGELGTAQSLMGDTFETRMNGGPVSEEQIGALFRWMDGLRPVRATVDDHDAIERGWEVFVDAGCESCHSGPMLTNNQVVAVREGREATKVPTLLGIGMQDHLMHDGCASSIEDRLTGDDSCTGGDWHGDLNGRSRQEIKDLSAFLRSR